MVVWCVGNVPGPRAEGKAEGLKNCLGTKIVFHRVRIAKHDTKMTRKKETEAQESSQKKDIFLYLLDKNCGASKPLSIKARNT